jgi:Apea-like HEPN
VASDLAGYLAGPPTDIWDYAIFDGHGTLQDAIPVVDGWELVTPSADELRLVLPLPSTAAYQPDRPFDPGSYRRLVMLRHVVRDGAPQRGPAQHWDYLYSLGLGRPQWELLWQPLMALSLYADPALRLWARYRIEPRRRTDKLFDSIDLEIWSPDGETEIETPRTGAFRLDAHDTPMLRRFLDALSPRLTAALDTQGTKKAKEEAANRLQRCAEHFLIAGEHTYDEGEAVPGEEDDAILHYVIALEGLLAGRQDGDLTRKISQRAAILVGTNDVERLAIRRLVCDAYRARSDYAHGNKPSMIGKIDLAKLHGVVRLCILTRLILGDPTQVGSLHELADRALLSHSELQNQIHRPFDEFAQRAGLADRTTDHPA